MFQRRLDAPAERLAVLPAASQTAINDVVASAIANWPIAPRVKRLVTPSYLYTREDFDHFTFIGAYRGDYLLGTAAVDRQPEAARDDAREWLLHGLYVRPAEQGNGTGTRLVDALKSQATLAGVSGILVKAERHAVGFFEKQRFHRLAVTDPATDYPYRLRCDVTRTNRRTGQIMAE
jgi:GNAT superfamily N-acetyltransferase